MPYIIHPIADGWTCHQREESSVGGTNGSKWFLLGEETGSCEV